MDPSRKTAAMRRHTLKFATLIAWLAIAGCASGPSPGSIAYLQAESVKDLAMQCYGAHEGERIVYGGAEVWHACKAWADTKVRSRLN